MLALSLIRIVLYGILFLFSFILFCLCCARLGYTTHLPRGDPLNSGRDFYDPDVAFLLVCTLMSMAYAPFAMHVIHWRREYNYGSRVWHEAVALFVLWLFYIIGTSIATSFWGALGFCQEFSACRILSTLVAFAWLVWLLLTVLLVLTVLFGLANGREAWNEPMHGRWAVDDNFGGLSGFGSRRTSRVGGGTTANVPWGKGVV